MSTKKWLAVITALVVIITATALVVFKPWASSSTAAPTPSAAQATDIGFGVLAQGAEVDQLVVTQANPVTEELVSTRLTEPYDINLRQGGQPTSPITLWLPTTAKPGDRAFLASKTGDAPWEYLGPNDVTVVVIDGKNYLQATVEHLSIKLGFSPVDWLKQQWSNLVTKATAGIVVDTSIPTCNDQATASKLRYGLRVAQKGALTACVGHRDGFAETVVKNAKHYPLVVMHSGFERVSGPPLQIAFASLKFDTNDRTTLLPGDSVTLRKKLNPGETAQLTTEFNGWTQNLYRFDVASRAIVQMLQARLPAGASQAMINTVKISGLALEATDCVNGILAGDVPEMLSSCFTVELLKKIIAEHAELIDSTALLAEFFNGLGTWLVSEIATLDVISGADRATLQLVREKDKPVVTPSADPAKAFVGNWHTHDTTITVKSGGTGTIAWRDSGSSCAGRCDYQATFTYRFDGDKGTATITQSNKQVSDGGYYAFKVGETYRMTLDDSGTMLTLKSTSKPDYSIQGCGKEMLTQCGM